MEETFGRIHIDKAENQFSSDLIQKYLFNTSNTDYVVQMERRQVLFDVLLIVYML